MTGHNRQRLTPKKDLRDGRPVWTDTPGITVRSKHLRRDLKTEIAIVGGGISGALVALRLSSAGHDVVVLDSRDPGTGSTRASTAMIQFEIDTPLIHLARRIGPKKAGQAYLRSFRAVADLRSLIHEHDLRASWAERHSLYLAGNVLGYRAMKSEVAARRKLRLPSDYLEDREIESKFAIERTGAIYSEGSAEINPAQTSASCLRAAAKFGAQIFSQSSVAAIEAHDKGVVLKTRDGPSVSCAKVIFCTGYETVACLPKSAFDIVSSWAIATKSVSPDELWHGRCLIWEAADPYLYVRTTHDNRIVVGGEDSSLTDPKRRENAIANKSAELLAKVRRLLGKSDLEIDYAWAGAFAESSTGLPCIRELPTPNAFAVLGCGGNGITFSVIAADLAKAWIDDRADLDAPLFRGNID